MESEVRTLVGRAYPAGSQVQNRIEVLGEKYKFSTLAGEATVLCQLTRDCPRVTLNAHDCRSMSYTPQLGSSIFMGALGKSR
jgi:hypothetical protein